MQTLGQVAVYAAPAITGLLFDGPVNAALVALAPAESAARSSSASALCAE